MARRTPLMEAKQMSESCVEVKAHIKELRPAHSSGNTHDVLNGSASVQFFDQGLDLKVDLEDKTKQVTHWRFKAIRLPGRIKRSECSWRVEKSCVVVTLIKKESGEDGGTEQYLNWIPLLHANGIDQYDSSEDEDQEVNSTLHQDSLVLEALPFEVEPGKETIVELPLDMELNL